MALATYLRGLLRKSSSAKPNRPRRLNRVNLALETLESRVTPTTWTSITNSITNDSTVGFGGSTLVTIAGTDLPTDITRIEFWLNGSSAFQAATINQTTTAVTFPFPPASTNGTSTYDVHVYTTSDINTGLSISVKAPANITISPNSGSILGGTPVTISGQYLYGFNNIYFDTNLYSGQKTYSLGQNYLETITLESPKYDNFPQPGTASVGIGFAAITQDKKETIFPLGTFDYVNPTVPTWTFNIPEEVANKGFQMAIFGRETTNGKDANGNYVYWNNSNTSWTTYSDLSGDYSKLPLFALTPSSNSISLPAWKPSDTSDPYNNLIISGTVVMFIGPNSGIPISGKVLSVPTVSTNAPDNFSLFELTYSSTDYDVDISNVDQVGFTYTVTSSAALSDDASPSAAPVPLAKVGSSVPQNTLFTRFQSAFPASSPFNASYTAGTLDGEQNRLVAPQDVIQSIAAPVTPSYLFPTNTTGGSLQAGKFYWYMVTETNSVGQTAASASVSTNWPIAQSSTNSVQVGWQVGGQPSTYVPKNESSTGLSFYRAITDTNTAPDISKYGFLINKDVAKFNKEMFFLDDGSITPDTTKTPPKSSYSFSPLSSWFNNPLLDFFNHYSPDGDNQTFSFYQANQNNGSNGTLWTGKVLDVTPVSNKTPDPQNEHPNAITSLQYLASDGTPKPIYTNWGNWNDTAKQTYKVLQLVGNAYDSSNLSNPTPPHDASKLTPGEYEGAVLNIYFPFFQENTDLPSIEMPNGTTYTIPNAPSWLPNSTYTPGQMVFGCAGVFASDPGDPEAQDQQKSFPVLSANAMTNLENVIVSALNRGIATGYGSKLAPQQWVSPITFSQYPTTSTPGTGIYTYFLSAILPDGQSESVLSWPLSIGVQTSGSPSVTLNWLPQGNQVYKTAKIYRQDPSGTIRLVGKVDNSNGQAKSFTDSFDSSKYPPAPTNGAPFTFYPDWKDTTAPGFVNSNLFSAFLHQNISADPLHGVSINGLCYGYPFDDQGGFSTNINFGASQPSKTITFNISPLSAGALVSTTTTLSSNNNPSHLNDPVTFTATVSPASGTVAPTGTVSFYNRDTLLGTGTLTALGLKAVASFTTSSLKGHTNSITAAYSGNNAFDPSTSPVLTQTVDGAPPSPVATSVVIASTINPSNQGQTVTFTATVTASKGIPSGTVNFLDGATVIGTGTLNAQGVATFQTSTLAVPPTTHSITAAYTGSTTYSASTSSVLKQVVAPDGPASTSTTLVPNPNPTYAGHTVTFTATVAALRGTQVPTGTVTFLVDGTEVGYAYLSNGVATIQHAFATAGNYSLIAKYQGDISFAESQSPTATEVVNQPSSSTVNVTLSSSVNPSTQGQLVLFTAKLQPVTGSGSPTGIVDFYVNNVWQNSTTVFTDGSYGQVATWLTNALPLGDNSITAKYRGDSSFDSATSKPFSQVVTLNPNQIMQPADLGPGSYVAGVGNLLAVKPSFGEMQFFQPFPNYNGQVTVNTMDRDSDGKADTILAAVAGGAAPHVLVIDSNTGYLLSSFYAFSQGFLGGVTIAGGPVHLAPTGSATPVVVCGARAGAQPTVAVFDALGNGYGAFFAFDPAYKGGVNVAMSEANAQGNALVVVSSTINTHVKVFDIANVQPSELASYYTFGSANYSPGVWASAGDIDGKATQELLVGTAGGNNAARIKVYNLLTGAEIPGKVIKPFGDNYLGSVRVGLSDYNRDGVLDLLAASGPMAMGTVRAFDFDTLAELESLFVSNVTDGVFIATNFSRAGALA